MLGGFFQFMQRKAWEAEQHCTRQLAMLFCHCKDDPPVGDWRRWLAALGGGSKGNGLSGFLFNGECPLLMGTCYILLRL